MDSAFTSNVLITLYNTIVGLLFCQSVAFMIWQMLKFFSNVSDTKRWWLSFLSATLAYVMAFLVFNNFALAAVLGFFFSGLQMIYLLQEDLLHRYPQWDRSGVLYLSLLLGACVTLAFGVLFYLAVSPL